MRGFAAIVTTIAACAGATAQSFEGLGGLAAQFPSSSGNAVTDRGAYVVGQSNVGMGSAAAVYWTPSGIVDLEGLVGSVYSEAVGTSDDGAVIAGVSDGGATFNAVMWRQAGEAEPLGFLSGHDWSRARDVSGDGSTIIGFSRNTLSQASEAFRWTPGGGMQGLGFLPGASVSDAHGVSRDGSVIVGVSGAGFSPTSPREAFRWENGMMTGLGFLPGDTGSAASGVSADGSTIIGGSFVVGGIGSNNFRWTQAIGMEYLGPGPGGSNCDAIGVSGDGSVIVGTCYAATRGYASIWTEATGVRALEEVLVNDYGLDLTGWMLIVAFSVSPSGDAITGWGINPAGEQEAFLAVLSCTADCDRSSGSGVLDVFDFLCFQDLFVSGDPYACDCDTTTGARTCDVFDFLCFQDAFVAGCP